MVTGGLYLALREATAMISGAHITMPINAITSIITAILIIVITADMSAVIIVIALVIGLVMVRLYASQ